MEAIIRQIYTQAKLIGACQRFTGRERTLDELVALFLSPQGLEFCIKNRFPNLATFRQLKILESGIAKYGIYIDAGAITLDNPKRAVLVGRTTAVIGCDECERHDVVLMHGAKAVINASKWAVAFVAASAGCSYMKNVTDNAIIL